MLFLWFLLFYSFYYQLFMFILMNMQNSPGIVCNNAGNTRSVKQV